MKLASAFVLAAWLGLLPVAAAQKQPVTPAIQQRIVQAIQDEIYDYDYQGWSWQVAESYKGDVYQMRVYVQPQMDDYEGLVIYKLMPYGEVLRAYSVEKNGLIRLHDDPELGFGPERPDRLTIYQDDDDIMRFKREWLRVNYPLQLKPSEDLLQEAAKRQVQRVGHSVRLDPSWRRVAAGKDPRCLGK